jgi:uncharacterized repeat protein (TIGR01451 family)
MEGLSARETRVVRAGPARVFGTTGSKRRRRLLFVPIFMAALVVVGVLATGGSVLAASPTDASVNNYQQCANDKPGSVMPTVDPTDCVPQGWINGILNAQNSQYAEDQVTAQRLGLDIPSGGPTTGRTITIRYLARKGQGGVGNHAYDYLATWNFTQANADRCQDLASADCPVGSASTFPIPSDPTIVADSNGAGSSTALHELPQANRQMTMYGGTITNVTAPVHDNASGSGDDFATITVTYSVASTATDTKVQLLFGGHLAASVGPRGWGNNVGASFISGGPYHIRIDQLDGSSIGNRDNQINSAAILLIPATALTTNAGGPYVLGSDGTVALHDVATLTGGTSTAGGQITFMLFSDAACSTQVGGDVTTAVNGADGKDYTSPSITVNAPGTYYWVASYGGDENNTGSSSTCGDTNETPLVIKPHISISKSPDQQTILIGQTATFSITVTNDGDSVLTNVVVTDALAPGCARTQADIPALGSMAPGATVTYSCTLANVTSSFTNVAVATGTPPVGPNVTAQDTAAVTAVAPATHPAITIVKNPKSQTVTSGGTATFTITVTNTGDVALTNVTVSDALSPNCDKTIGTLNPGQSTSYTCTRANVSSSFSNVAIATGHAGATTVTAQDTAPVTAKAAPLKPKKVTKVTPKVVSHRKPKATG